MALILYFFLAIVGVFALIASWPLLTEAYHEAKEDIIEGGWMAAIPLLLRGFLWLIAFLLTIWVIAIGGMFL